MASHLTDWNHAGFYDSGDKAASGDIITGTDDLKFATAKSLRESYTSMEPLGFALSDETTALTAGQKLATDFPCNYVVTRVYGSVVTAASGSTIQVDVEDEGASIVNSVLTFAVGANNAEVTSFSGATASYSITKGRLISFDVDQVGSSVAGAGLKVYLDGYRY